MKIISKYKDYYDHIAHIYGADPSIVYIRKPIEGNLEHNQKDIPLLPYWDRVSDGYDFKWLSVCAKLYCLVQLKPSYAFISPSIYTMTNKGHDWQLIDEKHPMYKVVCSTGYFRHESIWQRHGKFSQVALDLTKKVGVPVFTFVNTRYDVCKIDELIPILGQVGLAAVYAPEQLYQDLSYFICNVMKDSPDMAKPSNITDKEKICSHGFDLKQSFRHRK